MGKRSIILKSGAVALSILMMSNPLTIYAGSWNYKGGQWTYKNDNKSNAKGWLKSNGKWYYLDPITGVMKSGWLFNNGKWYFLDTNPSSGAMLTGWQWIDGYCYYFSTSGDMLAGTITPDGYYVNTDGRYVERGKVAYAPEKGIKTIKTPQKSTGGKKSGGSSSSGRGGRSSRTRVKPTIAPTKTVEATTVAPATEASKLVEPTVTPTAEPSKTVESTVAPTAESSKTVESTIAPTAESSKTAESTIAPTAELSKTAESTAISTTEESKVAESTAATADELVYTQYTKDVRIDFGEYVVVTFKYGTVKDYNVYVDGTDITDYLTNVDDDGHVVKWLSSVISPKILKVVAKADTSKTQEVDLGGTTKEITKVDVEAPKYVISNGPVSVFDYYLETYDKDGNVRKNADKTTFTLQEKKTDTKKASEPSKYYIPVTEVDSVGNGEIKIKLSLENDEQKAWFEGLDSIKALNSDSNIINPALIYTTSIDTKHGTTGVIHIPLPQSNLVNRGDYYVSLGSSASDVRVRLPISLVDSTAFKVYLSADTPSPKVGQDIAFKIKDPKNQHSFGNDAGLPMYKVTLTKPDGTVIDLPRYDGWYNIVEIVHIKGTDATSGKVYTDDPGVYTATIYATGYKTMVKKFEVGSADGRATTSTENASTTVDSISSATVNSVHSGKRTHESTTATTVTSHSSSGKSSTSKKTDAVSGATKSKKSDSLSKVDAVSGATGSTMRNVYLSYDYDLLANAMILNQIGMSSEESKAVLNWWYEQIPEAIIGEDKSKIYLLDHFVDAVANARLEGKSLSFADYAADASSATRSTFGEVKNVLENGKLGTLYRYGNTVGKKAPSLGNLVQPKSDAYTFTLDNSEFISAITQITLDDNSAPLRSDSYLKQYSIGEDKKSITLYPAAFNEYLKPVVGKHKLFVWVPGYEKVEYEFTITDTLENVTLTDESEKLEAGSAVTINASNAQDAKKGDFLSKLNSVSVKNSDGVLKTVLSSAVSGQNADDVYKIENGKIVLLGGVFAKAGDYTIYLKAAGYPVKSIQLHIGEKPETPTPETPKNTTLPTPIKATENNSVFYSSYTLTFEGLEEADLENYLKAVTSVKVNGEEYEKAGSLGLGFGNTKEFVARADSVYGGKVSQLEIKGSLAASNKIEVIADGYEPMTFTLDARGKVIKEEETTKTSENENTPATISVNIESVEATTYNYTEVYAIRLAGDDADVEKFVAALNNVVVNGKDTAETNRISSLSNDGFLMYDNHTIYVKSRNFKGLGDEIVLKGESVNDIPFTSASKYSVPNFVGATVRDNYPLDKTVRLTFDNANKSQLKNFLAAVKKDGTEVSVNGVAYHKVSSFSRGDSNVFKVTQNYGTGKDEFIDLSKEAFQAGKNTVKISSDLFDTVEISVDYQ